MSENHWGRPDTTAAAPLSGCLVLGPLLHRTIPVLLRLCRWEKGTARYSMLFMVERKPVVKPVQCCWPSSPDVCPA